MTGNYLTRVNTNENLDHHWAKMYDLDKRVKYAAFIPTANRLIKKHCKEWWKNHPESLDFNSCQHKLCRSLESANLYKELTYLFVAQDLNCNPFIISNDPEFSYLSRL
jgi:hypothetical protein